MLSIIKKQEDFYKNNETYIMIDEFSDIPLNVNIADNATIIRSNFEGNNFVGNFSTVAHSFFGKYSYISEFSIIKSVTVGKFTSISWGCSIGPEEHDCNRLTSHSILTSIKTFRLFEEKFYNPFSKETEVSNDV